MSQLAFRCKSCPVTSCQALVLLEQLLALHTDYEAEACEFKSGRALRSYLARSISKEFNQFNLTQWSTCGSKRLPEASKMDMKPSVNKALAWFVLVAASTQVSKRPRIDALSFNSVTRALTRPGFTGL